MNITKDVRLIYQIPTFSYYSPNLLHIPVQITYFLYKKPEACRLDYLLPQTSLHILS